MRKKTEQKRQTILNAARGIFLETGFQTSSMDDIAARAAVSKATVYSYFPSKDALFMEVLIEAGKAHGEAAFDELFASEELAEGLRRFGERQMTFISTPGALALARLAITEGERSSLGRDFYARGPGAMVERLAQYLEHAIVKGQLGKGNPRQMAEHLNALYEAGIVLPRLFGLDIVLDVEQQRAHVARAVDIFLGYYALSNMRGRQPA